MHSTKRLLQQRTPMIKFLGKRTTPNKVDHTPHAHPASPTHSLPQSFTAQKNSFASYRQAAQQHGPLNTTLGTQYINVIGRKSGASLGSIDPEHGEAFDRSELPNKYGRLRWTAAEIEAIESGGASLVN